MRVGQHLDYAVRALVLLASQPPGARVASRELAQRLSLPRRFVEQQMSSLAKAGIVECRRGAGGGCALAREASALKVRDVVVALDGGVLDVPHHTGSSTSEMWQSVAVALENSLAEVTIDQLVRRQREIEAAAGAMYFI